MCLSPPSGGAQTTGLRCDDNAPKEGTLNDVADAAASAMSHICAYYWSRSGGKRRSTGNPIGRHPIPLICVSIWPVGSRDTAFFPHRIGLGTEHCPRFPSQGVPDPAARQIRPTWLAKPVPGQPGSDKRTNGPPGKSSWVQAPNVTVLVVGLCPRHRARKRTANKRRHSLSRGTNVMSQRDAVPELRAHAGFIVRQPYLVQCHTSCTTNHTPSDHPIKSIAASGGARPTALASMKANPSPLSSCVCSWKSTHPSRLRSPPIALQKSGLFAC
ncbi:hypothetical protein B0T14DRAFT_297819 [Immersiella caudata]|uniref:Uncharacterized protein n=1 Tax=Immersiella caudata TaxID=314043 RepID=A0AA39WEY8_9PEZI|nr:hypothetical protein B0T14DRAFT_297819 [Immersiella caudata]